MRSVVMMLVLASLVSGAAIFGFFYAWTCSTMWGLDTADPRVAIAAMQAMNASVKNAAFAPAFFGTPVILAISALVFWGQRYRASAVLFGLSSAIYLCFGLVLTIVVNVPMNEALASVAVPADIDAARAIWQDYSPTWQVWNQIRTVAAGLSFVAAVMGAMHLRETTRLGKAG